MKEFNDIKFKRKLLFTRFTRIRIFIYELDDFQWFLFRRKLLLRQRGEFDQLTGLKTMNIDSLVPNEIKKKKKKTNKYFIILTTKHFLLQYDCERQH